MVKNDFEIGQITIESTAKCFCPLGNDWYTNNFKVIFTPGEYIPDYCKVDKWIEENINGHHMIIEQAVAALYDYMQTYRPYELYVESYVDDARHSAVTVYKVM